MGNGTAVRRPALRCADVVFRVRVGHVMDQVAAAALLRLEMRP